MRADHTLQPIIESGYDDFDPAPYLDEFYRQVDRENRFILQHFHRVFSSLPPGQDLVDLGGGPTIYQDLSAARVARQIVFTDYLPANRRLVQQWVDGGDEAFDWTPFASEVARLEGGERTPAEVLETLRRRISGVHHCDLLADPPLGALRHSGFDAVISAFCIESITAAEQEFDHVIGRISALLRPGGHFVGVVVRDCEACRVGNRYYRTLPLDEMRLERAARRAGLRMIGLETMDTEPDHGYTGIIAFTARRG